MIRPIAFALAAVVALSSAPAFAYCQSLPDGPDSSYVLNGQALALCQQAELGQTTEKIQTDNQLRDLEQALERQQLELQQQQLLLQQQQLQLQQQQQLLNQQTPPSL